MFKIGQKVVCVKEFEGFMLLTNIPCAGPFPLIGEIYTVDGISYCGRGIYLKEIKKSCFAAYKFRIIDETFAEETLKNIAEQIEQEQLVLI